MCTGPKDIFYDENEDFMPKTSGKVMASFSLLHDPQTMTQGDDQIMAHRQTPDWKERSQYQYETVSQSVLWIRHATHTFKVFEIPLEIAKHILVPELEAQIPSLTTLHWGGGQPA